MLPAVDSALTEELERLRTANATMKEELDGLYMQLRELREQQPAAAQYVQPAPIAPKPVVYGKLPPLGGFNVANPQAAMPSYDPVLKPLDAAGQELLQKWLAKNNVKMPWEDA